MPELEIDDRVTYKIFRDKTYYVVGFESRHPQSVRIGERGPSGKILKNTVKVVPQVGVELWSDEIVGENGSKQNNKWKNRIVAHGVKRADQFQAHPNNWRKHPMFQRDVIAGSLNELGWVGTVTENVRTGNLIDGHERVWQALQDNEDVPFIQVDLSEEEETKALLLLDSSSALAMVDSDNLSALLADVTTGSDAIQTLLDGLQSDSLQELLNSISDTVSPPVFDDPPEDEGAQIDRAAELQEIWQVKTGDVWEIESKTGDGFHRLLCGDSTNADDVALLMGGDKCDAVVTDPPYAFGLGSTNKMRTKGGSWHDMMNNASWFADLYRQWEKLIDSGCIWVFTNWRSLPILMRAASDAGVGINNVMVWYKDWIGPGGPLGLRPTYELITLTVLGGKGIPNRGVEDFFTAQWASHKPTGHLAEKPEKLMKHLIEITECDLVYDPFAGSGTTAIAAEQLGRLCRMVEASEAYCSIILERMQDLGLDPQRVTHGA